MLRYVLGKTQEKQCGLLLLIHLLLDGARDGILLGVEMGDNTIASDLVQEYKMGNSFPTCGKAITEAKIFV